MRVAAALAGSSRRRLFATLGAATVAGIVLLNLSGTLPEAIGAILVTAVLVVAIGLIVLRLGPQSQPDREREERAREEFARTGEWPSD